jgi:hypothetical protein
VTIKTMFTGPSTSVVQVNPGNGGKVIYVDLANVTHAQAVVYVASVIKRNQIASALLMRDLDDERYGMTFRQIVNRIKKWAMNTG